ncbi:hypothetical protein [Amycolatopsis vancoresmycina]|uniref:Uncharacterized protein n=1 Tax=Amycolatopsis vancoresmycina DSM 44592 TaxID=1292037 RepID=R1G5Y0_9PSEU|nr:hypothetical protein [Amycolatopsis vancoresmycina]EOD66867.1 hypothetical protein H480_19128 [Amycolatopsis vancoresmycina DSM 44592]
MPPEQPNEPTSQGGYEVTEQTGVTVEELPGPGAKPTTHEDQADDDGGEQLPSSDGPKPKRDRLNEFGALLKDGHGLSREDGLAVVSMMLDQPITALSQLSAAEVEYLFRQVGSRSKDEFAGMVERARRIAAGG